VSVSDEEPYSTIFASLKHPIRRRILRMLSKKPMSFSEMLEVLGVSSSFLTYHLENLGELVAKIDDNKYRLSSFGEAAIATMTKVEDIPTTASKMSETKATETKPKKVVGRSVAIALGIICILLIAFIAYFSITGISAQNSYNNLQNQNKQLQKWVDGNETLLNQTQAKNTNLQNQIDSLNSNVTNLQNQMNNFHIGSTENSTIWVNNEIVHIGESVYDAEAGENFTSIGVVRAIYVPSAGYVSVRVSSDNNSTFVVLGVPSAFNGINSTYISFPTYDQINVGFGGTVVFPVSPTSYTEIFLGSSVGEATLTITITYYY
jgi:cell division protein FtsB